MNAMILAAGLGTRLKPYTNNKPKALVEINGQPLLHWAIQSLIRQGFERLVVNVHHFGDQVIGYLKKVNQPNVEILISDERQLLLNTGGGIKKAMDIFDNEPFLIHNTDILTNLDVAALYRHHIKNNSLATLAVRHRESSRYLLFDKYGNLCGWRNAKTGALKKCQPVAPAEELAFSGIHVIDPRLRWYMPDEMVFSIIDVYLTAGRYEKISSFDHSSSFWMDVGRVADLEKARAEIWNLFGT